MTGSAGLAARMSRIKSSPLRPGRLMSAMTRSHEPCCTSSNAWLRGLGFSEFRVLEMIAQQRDQSPPHNGMIIYDENPHEQRATEGLAFSASGMVRITLVPCPDEVSNSTLPPTSAARSNMPTSPNESGSPVVTGSMPTPSSWTVTVSTSPRVEHRASIRPARA